MPSDSNALRRVSLRIERPRPRLSLTYFEVSPLWRALLLFQDAGLDAGGAEVRLGVAWMRYIIDRYRVAPVNWLDHQEYLGDTRDSVALRKSGILRLASGWYAAETDSTSTFHCLSERQQARLLLREDHYGLAMPAAQPGGCFVMTMHGVRP